MPNRTFNAASAASCMAAGTTLLFGGTFDPIHHGHLITAQGALEFLGVDRCVLIPAHTSPHKQSAQPAAAKDRVAMLQLAIEGDPRFSVDELELCRPPPSYTFETVQALKARQPNDAFILLFGTDQLPRLHTWHRIEELLALVRPALLARPGALLEAGLGAVGKHLSSATAERLRENVVRAPQIDISATQIRQRAAAGLSLRYLVPERVAAYIQAQRLYI